MSLWKRRLVAIVVLVAIAAVITTGVLILRSKAEARLRRDPRVSLPTKMSAFMSDIEALLGYVTDLQNDSEDWVRRGAPNGEQKEDIESLHSIYEERMLLMTTYLLTYEEAVEQVESEQGIEYREWHEETAPLAKSELAKVMTKLILVEIMLEEKEVPFEDADTGQ